MYLHKFRSSKYLQVHNIRIMAEAANADKEDVTNFHVIFININEENYLPEQVFNVNESG